MLKRVDGTFKRSCGNKNASLREARKLIRDKLTRPRVMPRGGGRTKQRIEGRKVTTGGGNRARVRVGHETHYAE